jgi:hypothetical protein
LIDIRPFQDSDWPHLWPLLRNTFAAGDTYSFAPEPEEDDLLPGGPEVSEEDETGA